MERLKKISSLIFFFSMISLFVAYQSGVFGDNVNRLLFDHNGTVLVTAEGDSINTDTISIFPDTINTRIFSSKSGPVIQSSDWFIESDTSSKIVFPNKYIRKKEKYEKELYKLRLGGKKRFSGSKRLSPMKKRNSKKYDLIYNKLKLLKEKYGDTLND